MARNNRIALEQANAQQTAGGLPLTGTLFNGIIGAAVGIISAIVLSSLAGLDQAAGLSTSLPFMLGLFFCGVGVILGSFMDLGKARRGRR